MATPSEKLADSLEILRNLQKKGTSVVKGNQLTQTHRERLVKNGFLKKVMRGWYIPTRLDEIKDESTSWFASFWDFCKTYLNDRFGEDWWISPEQSLSIHSGNWSVRSLLGHFTFVYIHPYMDGNGRIARFLMNTMLASGGYPWTIIEVKERKVYMEALEEASVRHNIRDFAEFVGSKVKEQMT